jgi:UDP-4-amino-4,6-dideoxy-N-acetyl-beta-L-altrosamine transaminase
MNEKRIPYGRQWVDGRDIDAVVDVLRSDRLTQGCEVEAFEHDLAEYCGARFAVAVSSGTAALHLACLALGTNGDVITSPLSFLASANSIIYAGGRPLFVDIDPVTYNVSLEGIERRVSTHPEPERLRGITAVHFAGLPCDVERIREIANRTGLFVLEDACHALGATWTDASGTEHRVGDCAFSDAAVFSFHPVKHITTGEGGAILTNRPEVAELCRTLRAHGVVRGLDGAPSWLYEMTELGFNYRITDLQCALGRSQIQKLEDFVASRRRIAAHYDGAFGKRSDLVIPPTSPGRRHAYHLYPIQVGERDAVFEFLQDCGIDPQVHFIPIHLQPYYRKEYGHRRGDFPEVEACFARALSLPLYPAMTDEDVRRVVRSVEDALEEFAS